MSIDTTTADKHVGRDDEAETPNTVARDLQCDGWGGWDARDVLAGRVDATTVRQAVEVGR